MDKFFFSYKFMSCVCVCVYELAYVYMDDGGGYTSTNKWVNECANCAKKRSSVHACVPWQTNSYWKSVFFTYIYKHIHIHIPMNSRCTTVFINHFSIWLLFLLSLFAKNWLFVAFIVVVGLQSSNHAVNGQDLKTFTINKMSNNLKSRQPICNIFFFFA